MNPPNPAYADSAFNLFSLQDSNADPIINAIASICWYAHQAKFSPPSPFADPNKLYKNWQVWELPTVEQVPELGGLPLLAVRFPTSAGLATGGVLVAPEEAYAQAGTHEPVWQYEIYSLWPYDPREPTYADAQRDCWALYQALYNNQTLGGTCTNRKVVSFNPTYVELLSADSEATTPCAAAYIVLHAYENLTTYKMD